MTDRRPVAFFGSGAFAVPILDALRASDRCRVVAVITAPPRPAGRRRRSKRTPVHDRAEQLRLPVLTPTRLADRESVEQIAALSLDFIVLADYGRLVPAIVLDLVEGRALNLHPSLLPRHRGASPIPATILAGDAVTGVTLMIMDRGLDTGPVIAQARTTVEPDETAQGLEARLARSAADLLIETLPDWLDGRRPPVPQAEEGMTMTRPLRREDGRLDPMRPVIELARMVRAYDPWPGAWFESVAGRIAVHGATAETEEAEEASVAAERDGARPGTLVAADGGLALVCLDGRLRLDRVQPAGGRVMTGAELRRGRPELVSSRVGEASLG